jgi:VWFA-related protein
LFLQCANFVDEYHLLKKKQDAGQPITSIARIYSQVRSMRSSTKNAKPANRPLARIFIIAVALHAITAHPQETTIRSQANVVLIPALVKDPQGEVVYGLAAKDFIVEDDGITQTVHLDEPAETDPISLVVAVQVGRRASFELPRMRGLSTMLDPVLEQRASEVALLSFDSTVHPLENFTSDDAAINRDLTSLQPGDGGAAVLDAINHAVRLLSNVSQNRKRVLLLISETRDHGSQSATIDDAIKAIGNSNIVVYALAFSPSKSNVLDTLRGNNNWNLHPDQTEMTPNPDLLAPFVLAVEAMRKNVPRTVASMTGGEYELFATHKKFDVRMTDFTNHLHSRYLLSIAPKEPHPGLHQLRVRLKDPAKNSVLARTSYWAEERK